jgi:succinyl-diaminopimelate desuccinylase
MISMVERRRIAQWIDDNRESILSWTQDVLRVPSVLNRDDAGPGKPFGQPCATVLDRALAICERNGMRVRNFDGYAGHAEFGPEDAPEYIAVLGHLDVVPTGTGWSKDPWGGEISDGWIWGRGALDDKGPTMAALAGALAVKELGLPLHHRVRLIFGCDEENEWRCMEHYFGTAGQAKPKMGFTPDAGFPLYFAEKGALTAVLERPLDVTWLKRFQSGLAANMVPADAEAEVAVTQRMAPSNLSYLNVDATASGALWRATGQSAHGATPAAGRNAAVRLAMALRRIGPSDALDQLIHVARIDGSGLGLAGSDPVSGRLTLNCGVVELCGDVLRATVNIRFPVTWDSTGFEARFRESVNVSGWSVARCDLTAPLYVPVDAEPVKTLMQVYRAHTGSRAKPRAMGGRTYATTIEPNGVAFGPSMPGDESRAHQPDERFSVERFLMCSAIYAEATARLAVI